MRQCLIVLALLLSEQLFAQEHREAAFVADLRGEWICLSNHRDLRQYERLYSGDVITAGKNTRAGDSIQIVALASGEGSSLRVLQCTAPLACGQPYVIPAATNGDNWFARLVAATQHFMQLENRSEVFATTRGTRGPEEAVLDGAAPDLSAALGPVSPGEYQVKWTQIADGMNAESFTSGLVWNPPRAQLDLRQSISDGVYRLELLDESGEPAGAPAFVAVLRGEAFQRGRAAFLRFKTSSSSWRDQARQDDDSTYRSFAARALMAIAADPASMDVPHE